MSLLDDHGAHLARRDWERGRAGSTESAVRRLLVYFACLGVAAATATGCSGSSSPSQPSPRSSSPPATPTLALDRGAVRFSRSDTHRLRRVFLADRAYLARKGLRGAPRIDLRLLSGPDTFYCSPVQIEYGARGPGPDYCQPTADAPVGTVILNARFLSDEVPDLVTTKRHDVTGRQLQATQLGSAAAVLGHEMGHVEQALRRGHIAPLAGVAVELQADCYAGQMVARAEPRLLPAAMQFMRHVPGDSRHGSARQRLAAFKRGAQGGKCSAG
jgi:hypothetical protein